MERDNVELKVFNTAKVFAEQILFPLMADYKKFQRQSNFGSEKLDDSILLSEEIKDIHRFNGLKGMAETTLSLLESITSTVLLKKNKEEIATLVSIQNTLEQVISIFYSSREKFFSTGDNRIGGIEDKLDRAYFEKIRKIVKVCYINTEILMTRNKLLFSDAGDEFKNDAEIMDEIKREYSGE